MGSTRTSVLLLALGLAGCGRLGFGEEGDSSASENGGNVTVGVVDATARSPAVCERVTSLAATACPDADLALATTPTGITAVWVSVSGSDLMGVDIGSNRVAGGVKTIRSGSFTASTAAFLDGQLVAGGINTSRAIIHAAPQPLAAGTEIGNFDGDFVGKTTLTHSNNDRVTATSCSSGLTLNAFDTSWNGNPGTFTVNTNQTTNIDLTPLGTQSFAVWSTASSCHYETITSKTTGTARQNGNACLNARLTSAGTEVGMVFEQGSRVGVVIDDSTTVAVPNAVYITGARSPRVQWDGAHYWVSYLSSDNHIVIGYVDNYGMLLTTKLADVAPDDKAYELGMLDGQPWLFQVDASMDLGAERLCVPAY